MKFQIDSLNDFKKIPKKELKNLAGDIRERIIEVVKKNGGHLASNLGVVELTIALHYVFNSPADKIVFDVGHQSYTHKILTGRNNRFDTVRKRDGLSGFPRRSESIHDTVDAGHASTSISQAAGFAAANKLMNNNNRVIAVIGDGSLTGGVAFEGLNFTGHQELPLIVILNDNEMSIDRNVGAVSSSINKLAVMSWYQRMTDFIEKKLKRAAKPVRWFFRFVNKAKRTVKILFGYENLFTNLGFEYIGPIDGHDINELIYMLNKVKKNVKHPVLLHVKTIKGKGYAPAESTPENYHGVSPSTFTGSKVCKTNLTFTKVFSEKIISMAKDHNDIVAITAAMEGGTGLKAFKSVYPNRFFDVGIAEQHAVSFASTLAYSGLKPVFAVYSTFLLRALDQLCQDVCISEAPVIFAVDRAGVVGEDGDTHNGQFDLTYLRMMPNLIVLAPCDKNELELMLDFAYQKKSPVAIRYPKGCADVTQLNGFHPDINDNPMVAIGEGKKGVVFVVGPFVKLALDAVNELGDDDYSVVYLRQLSPFPKNNIKKYLDYTEKVVVISENIYKGSVVEEISDLIIESSKLIKFDFITLPDAFIEHGKRDDILIEFGFTKENLLNKLK